MCLEHMSRRDWLKLTALLSAGGAASLLSAFNARAQAEPDAPVRIGYLPITDAAPLLVAHNNGLFDKAGVKAEAHAAAQLGAGDRGLHLGTGQRGAPAVAHDRLGALRQSGAGQGGGLEPRRRLGPDGDAGDQQRQDLGGKTVAIPFWYSIHNVVLQYLLRENGLTPVSRRTRAGGGRGQPDRDGAGRHAAGAGAEAHRWLHRGRALQCGGRDAGRGQGAALHRRRLAQPRLLRGVHAERDLEQRPQWSQKVVDAIVQAQLWIRDNREETARLLSKEGINRYTPHGLPALSKVLAPPPEDRERYLASGAIRHGDWDERRIDFQPYPFPSYTEELVRRLRDTLIEADRGFLATLDPARAAAELVDDRYVRRAIEAAGGLGSFGFPRATSAASRCRRERDAVHGGGRGPAASGSECRGACRARPCQHSAAGTGEPRRPGRAGAGGCGAGLVAVHRRAAGRRRDGAAFRAGPT